MTAPALYRADGSPILPCTSDPWLFDQPEGKPDPDREDREWQAMRLCMGCPILYGCRQKAYADDTLDGIAGGTTKRQRDEWRKGRDYTPSPVVPDVGLTERQIVELHAGLRSGRSPVIADVIRARVQRGEDDATIAAALGLGRETIGRYRRGFGLGTAQPKRVARPEPLDERCGTPGAVKRHKKRGEKPCEVCVQAASERARERVRASDARVKGHGSSRRSRP